MKKEMTAWQKKERNKKIHSIIDWGIAVLLAVISILSIIYSVVPPLMDLECEGKGRFDQFTFIASMVLLVVVLVLYGFKYMFERKNDISAREYSREKKINEINLNVFDAISSINTAKVRETLRYTYGSVPEWNPIDYQDNILLYDVHEQIRTILLSIKKIVIGLDPTRFNDKNVSVELVYCYPMEADGKDMLPTKDLYKGPEKKRCWKLISSGDMSGNHSKVLEYLKNPFSFYSLLDYCGMKFANNKYNPMIDKSDKEKLKQHWGNRVNIEIERISDVFFLPDTKDMEYAKGDIQKGSAVGAVINVRNDDPEDIFIKAILTINTYGETFHVAGVSKKSNPGYDKDGLTVDDYKNIFCDTIIGTYENLLASELSQMYIRHSIRGGRICPLTGRDSSSKDTPSTLKISNCRTCNRVSCRRKWQNLT